MAIQYFRRPPSFDNDSHEMNNRNPRFHRDRDVPDDEPSGELLELAEALIEKKAGPFTPEAYHDRYVDAVRELIEQKTEAVLAGKNENKKDIMSILGESRMFATWSGQTDNLVCG